MFGFVYRQRHRLRLAGLALLAAGLALALGVDALAGLSVAGAGALVLATVQPQLLAHVRSRDARRLAPRNGHGPGADPHDLELPR